MHTAIKTPVVLYRVGRSPASDHRPQPRRVPPALFPFSHGAGLDRRFLARNIMWRGGEPSPESLHSGLACRGRQGSSTPDLRHVPQLHDVKESQNARQGRSLGAMCSQRRCRPGLLPPLTAFSCSLASTCWIASSSPVRARTICTQLTTPRTMIHVCPCPRRRASPLGEAKAAGVLPWLHRQHRWVAALLLPLQVMGAARARQTRACSASEHRRGGPCLS